MFLAFLLSLALPITQIQVGKKKATVEIAKTEESHTQGLMNRDGLEPNSGMLFIFEKPQILAFWMKNTKIPLSIAFFDEDQRLINIATMSPLPPDAASYPKYLSSRPACYALEMPQDWFQDSDLEPSMKFSFLD
jgi:uncharacterized membrane protein (UPF0127 family)